MTLFFYNEFQYNMICIRSLKPCNVRHGMADFVVIDTTFVILDDIEAFSWQNKASCLKCKYPRLEKALRKLN